MSLITIETLASSRKEHPWVLTIWLLPLEFGFITAELSWKVPCIEVMVGFQKLEVFCARSKILFTPFARILELHKAHGLFVRCYLTNSITDLQLLWVETLNLDASRESHFIKWKIFWSTMHRPRSTDSRKLREIYVVKGYVKKERQLLVEEISDTSALMVRVIDCGSGYTTSDEFMAWVVTGLSE
ncbi:hypothetical protein I9W82_000409 [Candida metapsilosis]|uniref:Uncharacterized protein n=1 Tax=Candida metapsilosis TaxID=273372 RepID=A0A8H7ZJD6_9ASCO|nr:hypothetical protein I9W82_000409 [Candida metapsilosis]